MAEEGNSTCYDITTVDHFQLYLEKSGEHSAILQSVQSVLPKNFRGATREEVWWCHFEMFVPDSEEHVGLLTFHAKLRIG